MSLRWRLGAGAATGAAALAVWLLWPAPDPAPLPAPAAALAERPQPSPPRTAVPRPAPPLPAVAARTASAPTPAVPPPPPPNAGAQGIAAFPAMGSKRLRVGIVVPEDHPLPPGYVRHYQVTDKGQMLPPILMFDPRRPPLDAEGRPLQRSVDGVVPPAQAPPGLPIRMLEIPADAYGPPEEPPRTEEEDRP